MASKLRVGYLNDHNYLDRNTFSGTLYYMYRALKTLDIDLIPLGNPYEPKVGWIPRIQQKLTRILWPPSPPAQECSPEFLAQVDRQLQAQPCDVIYAPVCKTVVSALETTIPIVSFSDATTVLLREGYNAFPTEAIYQQAKHQEQIALDKSARLVYSSAWAAQSAKDDFGQTTDRMRIIPLGANLDQVPPRHEILNKLAPGPCRLLFIGKDWQRKGGNIAYQTLLDLLEKGLDVTLTMVGSEPPSKGLSHPKLKIIPYLNKNIPQQQQKLAQLLLTSHFLVFPTRSDCSPIVICEANAHGLPVVATDVGGISSLITPGVNGFLLPLSAPSEAFAEQILTVYGDRPLYEKLVNSARDEYEQRLNWSSWAAAMAQIFTEIVA